MWIVELLIIDHENKKEWKAVRASYGRYEFETQHDANDMVRMCYGGSTIPPDEIRLRKIN